MRFLLVTLVLAVLASTAPAGDVDLRSIDRQIATEPDYRADDPLYGLAVFGPEAKTHVWMVLDKSDPAVDAYDVLFVDLDGDGDLTDAAERFAAEEASKDKSVFKLPDFKDPHSGITHTDFGLRATRGEKPIFMIRVKWRGKLAFGGGYAPSSKNGYMRFATSAKNAPIVWLNGDGPFRFQRWYSDTLRIGQADDLKVFLGNEGVGRHSFASFQCHALPEGEIVLGTLLYQDQRGNPRHEEFRLEKRC